MADSDPTTLRDVLGFYGRVLAPLVAGGIVGMLLALTGVVW